MSHDDRYNYGEDLKVILKIQGLESSSLALALGFTMSLIIRE